MPEGFEKRRTKRPHLFDFIYGSLPQLAEGNGSNPFKFRFKSEVNYHEHYAAFKFYQSRRIRKDVIYDSCKQRYHNWFEF